MEGIPFRFLAPIVPFLLGGYYVFVADASVLSKAVIAVILISSIALLFAMPTYFLWALLIQTAVGIYIVFYLIVQRR